MPFGVLGSFSLLKTGSFCLPGIMWVKLRRPLVFGGLHWGLPIQGDYHIGLNIWLRFGWGISRVDLRMLRPQSSIRLNVLLSLGYHIDMMS